MEGPRDRDLVGGYGVGVQGRVNKPVSDDDQLRFEVTGELDWEQGRREGHWEAMVDSLDDVRMRIAAFARGFCFPFMLSKGWHL